jgi:hypothetical protein
MKRRPFDYLAIAVSLLAIGGFSVFAYSGRGRAGEIMIEASGALWIYSLDVDRRESVHGPLGSTLVVIQSRKASVEDSPCPDRLCVHMPAISKPGQWIACLPNRVFVRVRGSSGEIIDGISY